MQRCAVVCRPCTDRFASGHDRYIRLPPQVSYGFRLSRSTRYLCNLTVDPQRHQHHLAKASCMRERSVTASGVSQKQWTLMSGVPERFQLRAVLAGWEQITYGHPVGFQLAGALTKTCPLVHGDKQPSRCGGIFNYIRSGSQRLGSCACALEMHCS